ncbi:MAG: AAA family ATPase [Desulfovibrio sp.]|jgi:predicted ATPase|nr:AAA family ATPase [Desulfovibrio sp.]
MHPFIKSISLQNFLSFGAEAQTLALRPLNVLIGPNGSGKSNFLEAFDLLRAAPDDFMKPIREGGGTMEWLWKGTSETPTAKIAATLSNPKGVQSLVYSLAFTATGQRFELIDERIENEKPHGEKAIPLSYYQFNGGKPLLRPHKTTAKEVTPGGFDCERSILAQRRDPDRYPVVTYMGDAFAAMRLYREWSLGRNTAPRKPQSTDMPNAHLLTDCSNLALVLNYLQRDPIIKSAIVQALHDFSAGFVDYHVQFEGGTVQIFFHEKSRSRGIPATRLSDGTLRFLCLLAVLLHPSPPPLVCIEEPELGMHPDVLPTIANLLREASTRTQIIATTHSDILIDALTETPDSVVVCERHEQGTHMKRLNKETIAPFLEGYRLGQLWLSGELGGTRW